MPRNSKLSVYVFLTLLFSFVPEGRAQFPYNAPTCTPGTQTGTCGVINYSTLALPAENVPFTDPDFTHTSNLTGICGATNKTCMIRVTGPALWASMGGSTSSNPCPGATGYGTTTPSFHTPSGSAFNVIDVNDDEMIVGTNPGSNCPILLNFNPLNGQSTFNQVLPISGGTSEPHFSKTQSRKTYGFPSATKGYVLDEYDTAAKTTAQLVDLSALCNFPISVAGLTGGGVDTSFDVAGKGYDSRYAGYIGPQNTATLAYVWDRPTNTCWWYDVVTGDIGGSAGTPSCTGCGQKGTGIHGVAIAGGGGAIQVSLNGVGVTIFQPGTLNAWHASSLDAAGHRAIGMYTIVDGPTTGNASNNNGASWITLDTRVPNNNVAGNGGQRLPSCCDQHNSWTNVNSTDSNWMWSVPYGNGTNAPCQDSTVPGTNEFTLVLMDGSGTVQRFGHVRKNVCLDSGSAASFYHDTSGNLSKSGHFAITNTDWDGTLGQVTQGGTTIFRDDVLIVELYPAGSIVASPPPPAWPTGLRLE